MSWLTRILGQILNPRTSLKGVSVSDTDANSSGEAPASRSRHIRVQDILLNFPLMLGMLIVVGLFLLVLFGPVWAPQNPYITGQHIVPHFDAEKDVFIRPPLEPSPEFPLGTDRWGTDLLSLLMHGARNTLIACAFITMVRLILGMILGGYAGWNEGQPSDRIIMGAIGVTTSIPMLVSSMILIFALDIRKGLPVFIIALAVIGWTETAQFIRSEFIVLRKMPFIESARSIGSRGWAVAVRHILPNILPQVLMISFLEMGAVLMLLGELAFVGVYIGGGHQIAIAELMAPTQVFTLSEVPEWGAMLAEGFRWLRSKPFVVAPPAFALFISIFGFNALGEGIRRLIERRSINTAFLLKKRMLLVVAALTAATVIIINNTGASPWFTKVAHSFNGDIAYEHIKALSEMEGRSITQEGGGQAADYIESKFIEYGLLPGWKNQSYRYLIPTHLVHPLDQPVLSILDSNGESIREFQHQTDFGFVIEGHGGSGDVSLPITFLGFTTEKEPDWEAYQGLDLRGRIVLIRKGEAPASFATEAFIHGAQGILWITGNGRDDVRSQVQWISTEQEYQRDPNLPIFRIRPEVADVLLKEADVTFESIYQDLEPSQHGEGWFAKDLDVTVHMFLSLSQAEEVEVPSILGYRIGSDLNLAGDMVVIFTSYDGLGTDPDGTVFEGSNHDASGVGIMLEIARLWNEQELDPRRSVLFVAWSGIQLDRQDAREFFEDQFNFRHLITTNLMDRVVPTLMVQLDYAGAGGDKLLVHPDSSKRLVELLEKTAQETGVPIEKGSDSPEFSSDVITRRYQWISIRWSDAKTPPLDDKLDLIDREKIQKLGETLSLALINLVRESDF